LFGFAGIVDPQFDKLYIKLLHPLVDFIKYGTFLAVIVLCQRTPKTRKAVALTVLLIVFGTLMLSSQGGRGFFVDIAGRDYPLNLSILISGGKETNKDSLSNGE